MFAFPQNNSNNDNDDDSVPNYSNYKDHFTTLLLRTWTALQA